MSDTAHAIVQALDEVTRPRSKRHGTAILTCENHPTYRWVQTKYVRSGPSPYIGRGALMFEGEVGGKPACPDNMTERQLAEQGTSWQIFFLEHYTPECDCSYKDLRFVGWVD